MSIEITVKGVKDVQDAFARIARIVPGEIERALYEEAQVEKAESMRRTPVDTGALKGSHDLQGPTWRGNVVSVTISVGGPAAPYAIYVHENTEAWHNPGRSKFLESTILESLPFMAARIARRIQIDRML